jgi:predicted nucleotidyltransferase
MEQPNPLNEKLYIIRDIEGEQNTEAIEVIRELEGKLNQYPWFIGIGLIGSNVRGYNLESSDIDCRIIYDRSKSKRLDVIDIVKAHVEEIEKAHGFESGKITVPYMEEFDLDKIKKGLVDEKDKEHMQALLIIQDLSGIVIGEKVDHYRQIMKNLLLALSEEERQRKLSQVVEYFMIEEDLGEWKLATRTNIEAEEVKKLRVSRRELWQKRINSIWA